MNTGFYKDLDTNFEYACVMCAKNFTHVELIEMLKNGNIPQKQIAALSLDSLENKEEADILISNLTGCDGKIREAAALKVKSFLPQYANYFDQAAIFADASIDINPNVCRVIIDSVAVLKSNPAFSEIYLQRILKFIREAYDELDKFIFKDKKYVINKQLFKLYWCFESLKLFIDDMDSDELLDILERAVQEREYTIRENAAKIVVKLQDKKFANLREMLAQDENYYVKAVFN